MKKGEYKIVVDYKDVVDDISTIGDCSYCKVQGIQPRIGELKVYFLGKDFKVVNPLGEPICREHFNRIYKKNCYLIMLRGERTFVAATIGIPPTKFNSISLPEGKFISCNEKHNICLRLTNDEFSYFCIDCLKNFSKIEELIEHLNSDEKHYQGSRTVEATAGL